MANWIRNILVLGSTLLAFACDKQGQPIEEFGLDKLAKGISSEADVRLVMGQPDTILEGKDGVRELQYPRGPEGVRTWIFTIDKDGKLTDYRQVLTEENFARIKSGMNQDEVRRMLGKPKSVAQFKLKHEEVWEWRYLPAPGSEPRRFNVHFDMGTGKVTRTSTLDEIKG